MEIRGHPTQHGCGPSYIEGEITQCLGSVWRSLTQFPQPLAWIQILSLASVQLQKQRFQSLGIGRSPRLQHSFTTAVGEVFSWSLSKDKLVFGVEENGLPLLASGIFQGGSIIVFTFIHIDQSVLLPILRFVFLLHFLLLGISLVNLAHVLKNMVTFLNFISTSRCLQRGGIILPTLGEFFLSQYQQHLALLICAISRYIHMFSILPDANLLVQVRDCLLYLLLLFYELSSTNT